MATLPTFKELYQAAKAQIQLRRPDLVDFNEGSVLDAIAGSGAMLADEVMRVNVDLFAELFLDTATGDALDRLALDRFGVTRFDATAAVGVVQWTRDATGAYTIPAGTQFRGSTVVVQSTTPVSMLDTDTTVDVPCEAVTAGRSGNAAADTITEILSAVSDDPTATCTNAQPFAGGSEAETDDQFRDRLRRIYSNLRKGTLGALEAGALQVPGVTIVTVDESEIGDGGPVNVYVGDPDARSNDTLATAVDAELVNWRACGVLVDVLGSEREEVDLSLRLTVEQGADLNAVGTAVRNAIVAYGETLGPSDRARTSRIQKAAHDASDLLISIRVGTSGADLVPSAPQNAIRFTPSRIGIAYNVPE